MKMKQAFQLTLVVMCVCVSALAYAGDRRDGRDLPLPHDPAVTELTLKNGLRVIIKEHGSSPGRAHLEMVVRAGSLDEKDGQEGAAMYIAHMARNGSEHIPAGKLSEIFEEHGIVRPERRAEFATYDISRYQATLTRADDSSLRVGLTYLSDVLGRLTFPDAEVERVRGEALAEHHAGQGAEQRIREALLPRLAPGSLFAERSPMGDASSLESMTRADLIDFYTRTYRASNATLLIVGDVPADLAADLTRETFGGLAKLPAPAPVDAGLVQGPGMKTLVQAERELPLGYVEIVRLTDRWGAPETIGAYRQELAARVGAWCAQRQLQRAAQLGESAARESMVQSLDVFEGARFSVMMNVGGVQDWESLVSNLVRVQRRVAEHGFTEREIELARRALLAEAQQAARTEDSRDLDAVRWQLSYAIRQQEQILSAKQRLALAESLLPTISPGEAARLFTSLHDTSKSAVVLISDDPASLPDEFSLLRFTKTAMSRPAPAPMDEGAPEAAVAIAPEGGSVEEMTIHRDVDVLSAWLANGVRVHHRRMDERANEAIVSIVLAGGSIEETKETRGLTDAAARVFMHPATKDLSSADISDLLIGRNIRISARRGDDFVKLTIAGDPSELELGMQIAHLLLSSPRMEPGELNRWRQEALQKAWMMERQPVAHLQRVAAETLYAKADPRVTPLTPADIERVEQERVQVWLDDLVKRSPIEVSVVGDIERWRAVELTKRYLGSLPERARVDGLTHDALRTVRRADPPHQADVTLKTKTPVATTLIGFLSPDASERQENIALDVAKHVLSKRLRMRVQEKSQLVYTYRLTNKPAEAYPGFGTFCFWAPTAPEKVDELADAVNEVFGYFAAVGPTPEEVRVASSEMQTELARKRGRPEWWADNLSDSTYRGVTPAEFDDEVKTLRSLSASDVHETFQRHFGPANQIRLIVRPESPAEER